MSAVERLREFVNERLHSVTEEIVEFAKKIIVEHETEIDRQRRLLDVVLKPEIKLRRIELPQQHDRTEEELLTDQQPCVQESNSSLDKEHPEPPQIKEEQDDLCSSREGEQLVQQLVLKEETQTLMLTLTDEDSGHSEKEPTDLPHQHLCKEEELLTDQQLCIQERNSSLDQEDPEPPQIKEKELGTGQDREQLEKNKDAETFLLTPPDEESDCSNPEPKSDQQLLSHNFHVTENQDQKGGECGASGSTRDSELEPKKRQGKYRTNSNHVYNAAMSKAHCNTQTRQKPFKSETCRKDFRHKSALSKHPKSNTNEKLYTCERCGKAFQFRSAFAIHMSGHKGETPHTCKTCGKSFISSNNLTAHMRSHTDERPCTSNTCEKGFCNSSALKKHGTIHRPYACKTCGKEFRSNVAFKIHITIHKNRKSYVCKTCGKEFQWNYNLNIHMRIHTDDKPDR